jgi:hypothetical protein
VVLPTGTVDADELKRVLAALDRATGLAPVTSSNSVSAVPRSPREKTGTL